MYCPNYGQIPTLRVYVIALDVFAQFTVRPRRIRGTHILSFIFSVFVINLLKKISAMISGVRPVVRV